MLRKQKEKEIKLISMKEASRLTPYEQDYLSLLSRRGNLKAQKIGNKWYTTIDWLNDYLAQKKPEASIEVKKRKISLKKIFIWTIIFMMVVFLFYFFLIRPNLAKENLEAQDFVTDEILKIPNDEGGYDVYQRKK